MADVLLSLGADMGDPPAQLDRARELLEERGCRVLACSRDHWTEPWGFQGAGPFLNRALLIGTPWHPRRILEVALEVEEQLGRRRTPEGGYASRPIDIDILLHGGLVIDEPGLKVPHPLFHLRAFALAPAADVAPLTRHPVLGRTVLDLLNDLRAPAH